MNSEITPPVRRVLHEVGDAAPTAPSFDEMQVSARDIARGLSPRRTPTRRFVVIVGVVAAVIVIGVLAVSARHPAGSPLAPVTDAPTTAPLATDVTTVDTDATGPTSTTKQPTSLTAVVSGPSTTSAPSLAGVRTACTASDFTVTFTDSGAAAMGNIKWIADLTNISGSACVMPPSATLAGVNVDGSVSPLNATFGDTYFGNPPVIVGPLPAGATAELWLGGSQPGLCESDKVSNWAGMQLGLPDGSTVPLTPAMNSCGTPSMSTFGRPPRSPAPSGRVCPAPLSLNDVAGNDLAGPAAYDLMDLQHDIQTVTAYAQAKAADWAGYEITADRPARIKVWVTHHLAEHAADLGSVLDHPDRVDMSVAFYSAADLAAISNTIISDAQKNPAAFVTFAEGPQTGQVVEFGLAPGEEQLADQYINEYGNAIRVHVGALAYVPSGCGTPPTPLACPAMEGQDPASAGLGLALSSQTASISQSGYGTATLTVTNVGTSPAHMDTNNPLLGTLVYPGSTRVAAFSRSSKGTGIVLDLAPGQSGSINVTFTADRCDGQPGSAIPPGTYGLRVALPTLVGPANNAPTYLSPEIPVTVTAG